MKRAVFCSLVLTLGCGGGTSTAPSETSSPTPGPTIPAANRALVDPVLSEMSVESFLGCTRDLTAIPSRNVRDPGALDARDYLVAELARPGWEVSTGVFAAQGIPAYNVIAEWRGLDPSASTVIVSAHYDSSTGVNSGANDDAAGCAALVTLAEALSHTPTRFRHGIRLVAFAAEEAGLLGSAEYTRGLSPAAVLADVNLDGIAPRGAQADSVLVSDDPAWSQWLIDYTRRVVAIHAATTGVRSVAVYENHQWRTDTNSFWSAGVSGIWMLGNGEYRYANTAEDTLDKVDAAYGTRIARVSAAVALNLAEPTGRE